MKMQKCELLTRKSGEKDVLGNPILTITVLKCTRGFFSPWTAEETALLGRAVTSAQRQLLVLSPIEVAKKAESVRINDTVYDINSIEDLGRFRKLIVSGERL